MVAISELKIYNGDRYDGASVVIWAVREPAQGSLLEVEVKDTGGGETVDGGTVEAGHLDTGARGSLLEGSGVRVSLKGGEVDVKHDSRMPRSHASTMLEAMPV